MDKKNDMLSFAAIMVDNATKKYLDGSNDMAFFNMINGLGKYKLESFPGAGHNFYIILEAIYEYYKKYPEKKVDKILYDTLLKNINSMSSINSLSLSSNYIMAQLKNEKDGISPFELDNVRLLKKLKDAVVNNVNLSSNPLSFAVLENANRCYEETSGRKIM